MLMKVDAWTHQSINILFSSMNILYSKYLYLRRLMQERVQDRKKMNHNTTFLWCCYEKRGRTGMWRWRYFFYMASYTLASFKCYPEIKLESHQKDDLERELVHCTEPSYKLILIHSFSLIFTVWLSNKLI